MIEPYMVAICQAERVITRSGGDDKIKENVARNLKHYSGLIDFICGGRLAGKPGYTITGQVKLITFAEYAISFHQATEPGQKTLNKKEIIEKIAIKIPGPETDVFAAKAKQYGIYVAAQGLEYDLEWPDTYFNSGFIINPEGKLILKYRKTVTNVPINVHCSVHDLMDAYKNPITKEYDPFPVVDTEIGRLAIMICADLRAPEIPRVYSMKGADVVLHLTCGMSTSAGGPRPIGVTEASIQTRASDNAVYLVHSNVGLDLGAYYPKAQFAGYSSIYDYAGAKIAEADDSNEQLVRADIDIEACRKYRDQYFKNPLTITRTELYAPYYNQPIYPANTFLKDGPLEEALEERQRGYFDQARENFKKGYHFYSEKDV